MLYFVNQKMRKSGSWVNNAHVKESETDEEALNLAKHQFHAFMSSYAYGQDKAVDYAACSVESMTGLTVLGPEVDNRIKQQES